jgi:hypothetical protein
MYPKPPPELGNVPFVTIASLAEAAEKYEVFFAIHVCKTHFMYTVTFYSLSLVSDHVVRRVFPDHTNEILKYAANHEHYDLIQQMTPEILRKPLAELVKFLPPHIFIRWVRIIHSLAISMIYRYSGSLL